MAAYSFSGGDKLQAALDEIGKKMSGTLQVGFFEGETYPDGESVPTVAFKNEFGDREENIPPRPFFRTMIAKESPQWGKTLSGFAKASDYDGQKSLNDLGQIMIEQLTSSINGWTTPPNSAETIKRKGFNKPLIETDKLLKSPAFKVSE